MGVAGKNYLQGKAKSIKGNVKWMIRLNPEYLWHGIFVLLVFYLSIGMEKNGEVYLENLIINTNNEICDNES